MKSEFNIKLSKIENPQSRDNLDNYFDNVKNTSIDLEDFNKIEENIKENLEK